MEVYGIDITGLMEDVSYNRGNEIDILDTLHKKKPPQHNHVLWGLFSALLLVLFRIMDGMSAKILIKHLHSSH